MLSKEQQKAASDRIMAKLGPLVGPEIETYRRLTANPEDYGIPGEVRVCHECGAEFGEISATKDSPAVTALEQFSDHRGVHNPSPAQWAEAHKRIEAGKERAKKDTQDRSTG